MRSVRTVRDTPVVDHSVPGANSIRCIVYRPAITVSLFRCVLSVSYFKRSIGCCGLLWPYIGMCSLGTRLHRDCNAMGDAMKISPRVPSTCMQNGILCLLIILIIPSRQIYVAIDSPSLGPSVSCRTTGTYLWYYTPAADNVSHTEHLQSSGWQCFVTWNTFQMGSKLPEFWGIALSARANQYSTKAPSSLRSLILISHCSCHGRRTLSEP